MVHLQLVQKPGYRSGHGRYPKIEAPNEAFILMHRTHGEWCQGKH